MTLKECYGVLGEDYEEVVERFGSEAVFKKFAVRFPVLPDYGELVDAVNANDYKAAFRASHNMKGICLNMGFTHMYEPTSALCEEVRNGEPKADLKEMLVAVEEEYKKIVNVLKNIE